MSTIAPTATRRPIAPRLLGRGYDLAIAGAMGAVCGLYFYVELVNTSDLATRDGLAGALIGGGIGFFLNAADPLREGAWTKLARNASWGAVAGAAGGAVGLLVGEKVLGGFRGGLLGRSASWAILGVGIGMSQGLAYRSAQKFRFGLIGGGLGGLFGGFLFEALRDRLGNRYDLSQGLGMVILGSGLGLGLALVESALGRVWVRVLNGRQEGRSYVLSPGVSRIGLDERAEVGLFGDPSVARDHAEIVSTATGFFLKARGPTRHNGAEITSEVRLNDGDRLELGKTILLFRER